MPRLSAVGIPGIHAGEDVNAGFIAACWILWRDLK